jgi:RimJ/RimL family protein N-acetyltransferase
MTIRDSGPHEAELHLAIQREASVAGLAHIFPPDEYPFPEAEVLAQWREFGGRVLVAERDGRPVGIAGIESEWLQGFYVVPDEWGGGVATALHAAAVEAIAAAHSEARLWCLEGNARARRFYERAGWRANGTSRIVPFPPHPIDIGYTLELPRIAASAASWSATR